jgi:pilus assembly protein Flp/PilA
MKVLAHVKAFLKDEEGASGIEYAIIAGMVAIAFSFFVTPIGAQIRIRMNAVLVALGGTALP